MAFKIHEAWEFQRGEQKPVKITTCSAHAENSEIADLDFPCFKKQR